MITGGSCPHPLYRIIGVSLHRRAATADFAAALVPRVVGNTSRSAPQNPSAPSPTASTGARIPRRAQSRSRSAHDSVDSR
jgi:hypothetical protein